MFAQAVRELSLGELHDQTLVMMGKSPRICRIDGSANIPGRRIGIRNWSLFAMMGDGRLGLSPTRRAVPTPSVDTSLPG